MQINNGDKFVATKKTFLLNEGDVISVTDVNKYGVQFTYGDNHTVFMDCNTFENHFEKVVEKKSERAKAPTVTSEHVQGIIDNSKFEIFTVFDKCTVVACKLPNGFVIVESSACVSPENYNEELGAEICIDRIVDKVWELEGYKLQDEVHEEAHTCDRCECENVKEGVKINGSSIYSDILTKLYNDIKEMFPTNFDDEEEEDFDECLVTGLDCYDCEDYGCPWNPNTHIT